MITRDKVYSSNVRQFENILQDHFESEYACTISNVSSGILGTFFALGLTHSEIITTPFTWPGALTALMMLNNSIIFADIEEPTLTLNPETLHQYITPKTKAVFSADFFGFPCRLDKIREVCDANDIFLIHDAAGSICSQYKNKFSGYFSHISLFSFGRNKPFSTGEGGCLITENKELFNQIGNFIFHPERLDIQLSNANTYFFNTSMNPLAIEYGLKTFDSQMADIENKRKTLQTILGKTYLMDIYSKEINPNLHRLFLPFKKYKKLNLIWYSLPSNMILVKNDKYDLLLSKYKMARL
ncbi:MAG: DegT/DnrJ/EryC1/StrS family aminotransferase [Saprospiraceae bacterium]|nr:DegT/DnrJ/EryC1/StrS family aminotransferase [Saprospiraceae bacterium]